MGVMNMTNATYLLRNDTAANWELKNPILLNGEMSLENDTGLLKAGNGVDHYLDLKYLNVTLADFTAALETKLDKTGGTVTGTLTLTYAPTEATDAVTKGYVDGLINSAGLLKREIVDILPTSAEAQRDTIYMIKDHYSLGPDTYKEYLLIGDTLTQIGDTSVDLTNYLTKINNGTEGNLIMLAADGSIIDSGITASAINRIATSNEIGSVLSSDADNKIKVENDGTMSLNRVSAAKVFIDQNDVLILDGHSKTIIIE